MVWGGWSTPTRHVPLSQSRRSRSIGVFTVYRYGFAIAWDPSSLHLYRSDVGYGTIRIEGWFVVARRVGMRRDELRVELDAEPRSGGQQRPALVDCQPIPLNFLA